MKKKKPKREPVYDHLGNEYATTLEMCEYWQVPRTAYYNRRKNGWTLEAALTLPIDKNLRKNKVETDFLGNEFPSIEEMCRFYGITHIQYLLRIQLGWTKEKALTTKVREKKR